MELISRNEARELGLKRYFTGRSCKHGHTCERYVCNERCCYCVKIYTKNSYERRKPYLKQYQKDNHEKLKIYHEEWYIKNIEEIKSKAKVYRLDHVKDANQYSKQHYQKNIKNIKGRHEKYRRDNLNKFAAYSAKRRAAKLQRTPPWLTKEDFKEIDAFYKKAALFSKYCGQKYVVDHRIPLQGKLVSGLHVPLNLQVITEKENFEKNNKFTI